MIRETDSADGDPSTQPWRSRSHPVREDMHLQRYTWRVHRLAWVLLAGLIGAAALGLFGSGVLSSETAVGAGGRLEVKYNRFERLGASTRLQLQVLAGANEEVVVRFNPPFLEAFTIEALHPQPEAQRSGKEGAALVFRSGHGEPLRVFLSLRPERRGLVKSEVAIPGRATVRFTQFVFP